MPCYGQAEPFVPMDMVAGLVLTLSFLDVENKPGTCTLMVGVCLNPQWRVLLAIPPFQDNDKFASSP